MSSGPKVLQRLPSWTCRSDIAASTSGLAPYSGHLAMHTSGKQAGDMVMASINSLSEASKSCRSDSDWRHGSSKEVIVKARTVSSSSSSSCSVDCRECLGLRSTMSVVCRSFFSLVQGCLVYSTRR